MNTHFSFNVSKTKLPINSRTILWAALVVVMVFDLLTLRSAFTQVRTSVTSEPEVLVSRSARIDFAAYDQAVERITGADEYTPGRPPESNPFITAGEQ